MIKTIGSKERRIITTGAKENKIDPALVAKALGAERIGNVGPNIHNLPLPKLVQERLTRDSAVSDDKEENVKEIIAKTR